MSELEQMGAGRALIGAAVMEPERVLGMAADRGLKAVHFANRLEGRVWDVLLDVQTRRGCLDLVLAIEGVTLAGLAEQMDGDAGRWLCDCVEACATAAHAAFYVEQVVELAMRRELAAVGLELAQGVQREPDARGCGAHAAARVLEVLDGACGDGPAESNAAAAARIAERYCSGEAGARAIGLEWPWEHVTQMTCGLEPGLHVLAGRPSAGKTSIEDSLCVHLAEAGIPVGRITLDGCRDELLQRAMSRKAEVSLPKMKFGFAREDERLRFREAGALLGGYPMWFEDRRRDLDGILARAREWRRKHGIRLLTVDFMQLIGTGDPRVDINQVARVGIVSSALKAFGLDEGIPVLALSQLSRANAQDNREPQLHDLRGSGDIEQDAHQVAFVHVDMKMRKLMEEAHPGWTKKVRPVWFDLLKNKDGETGRVPMWMYPNYFKFEEPEENRGETVLDFETLWELGRVPKCPGE